MRKSHLLIAGVGAVLLAACSGDNKSAISDELKKDLELASSSDGIALANASNASGQDVVSAVERTTPPARKQAASARVRRHKPAPKSPPRVVQTETLADASESEPQTIENAPVAVDPAPPITPRPQPVAVSYPSGPSSGGDDGSVNRGSTTGVVLGTILGAVIRGGAVGGVDRCDPRTDGRRGGTVISINNRMPFPLPGRIGGNTRTGGNTASRFPH